MDTSSKYFIHNTINGIYLHKTKVIRAAGLTDKLSVKDALLKFSKVYKMIYGEKELLSEIPSSVEGLDEKLGTDIFPKKLRS